MSRRFTRREVFALGAIATASGTLVGGRSNVSAEPRVGAGLSHLGPSAESLNQFVIAYMNTLKIPGAIMGMVDRDGGAYSVTYGHSDLTAQTPISATDRFEIGSITKSFTAILVLQLQDEGRLRVHDPIRKYLPWLAMDTPIGEVTIHHLLTHSSGLPSTCSLFPVDFSARPRQTFEPGTQFFYSNWGYCVLGLLIEELDARPLSFALSERILKPLDMHATLPTITNESRPLIAASYVPLYADRPYPQQGALIRSGPYEFTFASGCIASTAADMTAYMRMLLNSGRGPRGPVLSEAAFRAFSTPYISAPEFALPQGPGYAPSPEYGYGIVIEQFEGRRRIRHSGGMPAFRSTMHVDIDAGVGTFVSLNANQGYGPNPVANFANSTLRAHKARMARPVAPEPDDEDWRVVNPAQYVGLYLSSDGRRLEVRTDGERLSVLVRGRSIPLQHVGGDIFVSADQRAAEQENLDLFPLLFVRAEGHALPARVIGIGYGADWYASQSSVNATQSVDTAGESVDPYVGLYYPSQSGSQRPTRIVARRGQLWLDGITPLVRSGEHRFRVGEESFTPEMLEFGNFVRGRAQTLMLQAGRQDRVGEPDTR